MRSDYKRKLLAGHWTITLPPYRSKKASKVFGFRTQLHCAQWDSLPFCPPILIVQWPERIFHFTATAHDCKTCLYDPVHDL